jgi:hypothetical protein
MPVLRELLAVFGVQFDDKALKKADASINNVVGRLQELGGIIAGSAGALIPAAADTGARR